MPLLNVPASYPPGYIGDPYNGDDISKFFDLNWPDHAGIVGQGYSAPGIGRVVGSLGRFGMGQTCVSFDEAGNCLSYDSGDVTGTAADPFSSAGGAAASAAAGLSLPTSTVDLSSVFSTIGITDSTTASAAAPYVAAPAGYSGPTVVAPNASTPAAPSGYQWAQLINASGQSLAKILTIAQGGSVVTLANGSSIDYGSATTATTAAATGSFNLASLNSSIAATTGLSSSSIGMIELVVVGLLAWSLFSGKK